MLRRCREEQADLLGFSKVFSRPLRRRFKGALDSKQQRKNAVMEDDVVEGRWLGKDLALSIPDRLFRGPQLAWLSLDVSWGAERAGLRSLIPYRDLSGGRGYETLTL
jgi:hypothetical protein